MSLLAAGFLLWTTAAFAEETRQELSWAALAQNGPITGGTVLAPDASSAFHRLGSKAPPGKPLP